MPKRIQMSRQHPWRADNPDAIIVARPGPWGNPFTIAACGSREEAVAAFQTMMTRTTEGRSGWVKVGRGLEFRHYPSDAEVREALAGHDLACWCPLPAPGKPDLCHAAVLLEVAAGGKR